MKIMPLLFALPALIFCTTSSAALERTSLSVCGDDHDWPPYHFTKDAAVVGYDIDVLEAIFTPLNVSISVTLLPWSRCLQETKIGNYDIALSSAYNENHVKDYIVSNYYYTLRPVYVYSGLHYPDGLPINSGNDIDKLRACGLPLYNYHSFGINDSKVQKIPRNLENALKMLKAKRCDVYLDRYEILAFRSSENIKLIDSELKIVAIPGSDVDKFYMLISREVSDGIELKSIIDTGLDKLRQADQLSGLLGKYLD